MPIKEENPKNRSFPDDLQRRMWITRGVRFVSEDRLKKKHLLSVLAINILSLCVIGLEIISILVKTKTHTMEILFPIAAIVAPVFIIVLSAHENAKRYLVYAERMHRSAQVISNLYSDLEFINHTNGLTDEVLNKLREDYNSALNDTSAHQDDVDYKYFQSLHPKPFLEHDDNFLQQLLRQLNLHIRGRIPYYFNVWFLPIIVTILPLGILLLSIWLLINAP